ncbi:Exosome complex component rrp45 [Erysiphe necator]|nr:Exosome complex component rrp45 [Erysiphe necator]
MPREAEPSLNERQFFAKALQEEIRLDGRKKFEFRHLEIDFGGSYGVVDLRLGGTRILTEISAELTQPHSDRPFEGMFSVVTELSPMAFPHLEPGRSSQNEMLISRLLEKTIRRSGALSPESLCLIAGQNCWSIRADIHVLSADGNIIDAASLAIVAALVHFKKPDTSTTGGVLTVYTSAEREPVPLSLLHWPLCVTFSFYQSNIEGSEKAEVMLVDTTEMEEHMRSGYMTVGLNRHGEICQVAKFGGIPVNVELILKCFSLASEKVLEFSKFITTRLQEDAMKKDKGGLIAELLSSENDRVS